MVLLHSLMSNQVPVLSGGWTENMVETIVVQVMKISKELYESMIDYLTGNLSNTFIIFICLSVDNQFRILLGFIIYFYLMDLNTY